jgi:hypothetical protein
VTNCLGRILADKEIFSAVLQSLFANLAKCQASDEVKAIVICGDQGMVYG